LVWATVFKMKFGIGVLSAVIAFACFFNGRDSQEQSPENRLIASTTGTYGARLASAATVAPGPLSDARRPIVAGVMSGQAPAAEVRVAPATTTRVDLTSEWSWAISDQASRKQSRAELARELHQELKRVGCYKGDIRAGWSAQSQAAMKAFNERLNATLPVVEPDFILLTMVRGHQDLACGAPCAADEVPASKGRCRPAAGVATHAKTLPTPATTPTRPAALKTAGEIPSVSSASHSSDRFATTRAVTVGADKYKPAKTPRRAADAPKKPHEITSAAAAKVVGESTRGNNWSSGLTKQPQRVVTQSRRQIDARTVFDRMDKS
jgi:hypothetical protein